MCDDCGCVGPAQTMNHTHDHEHSHDANTKTISIEQSVLSKNDRFAAKNRQRFADFGLHVINLISSPGSGKTTLLEALSKHFGERMAVIEGDIQTQRDADRIRKAGSRAHQIETGGACHLDAHAVGHAIDHLDLDGVKLLVIENVGNLVCPSTYDLGEHDKVAILSTPEGDDKVLKYPALFTRVQALIISKIDLGPYLPFDIPKAIEECRSLNNNFHTFELSAVSGEGMPKLIDYLESKLTQTSAE